MNDAFSVLRWSMSLNTSVRKNDLSHTSLKCSTTPLRHGSRIGMNRAVMSRSRHAATIGEKYCQAGGIPPWKLAWLSNWATAGTPTRAQIPHRAATSTAGRVSVTMSLPTRCEPTSIRFIVWNLAAPNRCLGPIMSI